MNAKRLPTRDPRMLALNIYKGKKQRLSQTIKHCKSFEMANAYSYAAQRNKEKNETNEKVFYCVFKLN